MRSLLRTNMPNAFLLCCTGEALQVTTKQQVLGTNAITSLLYNPTKIAHDSFSAPHYLLKMQLPPFYNVADFSQKVLGYRC